MAGVPLDDVARRTAPHGNLKHLDRRVSSTSRSVCYCYQVALFDPDRLRADISREQEFSEGLEASRDRGDTRRHPSPRVRRSSDLHHCPRSPPRRRTLARPPTAGHFRLQPGCWCSPLVSCSTPLRARRSHGYRQLPHSYVQHSLIYMCLSPSTRTVTRQPDMLLVGLGLPPFSLCQLCLSIRSSPSAKEVHYSE